MSLINIIDLTKIADPVKWVNKKESTYYQRRLKDQKALEELYLRRDDVSDGLDSWLINHPYQGLSRDVSLEPSPHFFKFCFMWSYIMRGKRLRRVITCTRGIFF